MALRRTDRRRIEANVHPIERDVAYIVRFGPSRTCFTTGARIWVARLIAELCGFISSNLSSGSVRSVTLLLVRSYRSSRK